MDACGSIGSDRVRRRSAVDEPRVDRGVVVKIHVGIESEDLVGQFEDGKRRPDNNGPAWADIPMISREHVA